MNIDSPRHYDHSFNIVSNFIFVYFRRRRFYNATIFNKYILFYIIQFLSGVKNPSINNFKFHFALSTEFRGQGGHSSGTARTRVAA